MSGRLSTLEMRYSTVPGTEKMYYICTGLLHLIPSGRSSGVPAPERGFYDDPRDAEFRGPNSTSASQITYFYITFGGTTNIIYHGDSAYETEGCTGHF
jgi:hypothetical protein